MDRSPEKSALLSTKVHSLEAKTGSTRQQFAHEAATTNAIFRPPRVFPSQSTQENSSKAASYSSTDAGLGRNSEQFISPLQAQYCSPTVPTAGKSRSFLRFFNYLLYEFVQKRRQPTAFIIFLSVHTWDTKTLSVVGHLCKFSCLIEGRIRIIPSI